MVEKIEERKCPKCGTILKRQATSKIRNNDKVEVVGYHYFCPRRECKHEEEEK